MKELITTEVLADSYLPGSPPSLTVSDGAFTLAFLWFLQLSVIKVAQKKKKNQRKRHSEHISQFTAEARKCSMGQE